MRDPFHLFRPGTWSVMAAALLFVSLLSAHAEERPLAAWAGVYRSPASACGAIVTGADCPAVTVDGHPMTMIVRQPSNADFAVTTCQVLTPAGAKFAEVGGHNLALAPRKIQRIVVIGDTGCRLKGTQGAGLQRPAKVALFHHDQERRRQASRLDRSCRRLLLS